LANKEVLNSELVVFLRQKRPQNIGLTVGRQLGEWLHGVSLVGIEILNQQAAQKSETLCYRLSGQSDQSGPGLRLRCLSLCLIFYCELALRLD
jgi:hypothetical protein